MLLVIIVHVFNACCVYRMVLLGKRWAPLMLMLVLVFLSLSFQLFWLGVLALRVRAPICLGHVVYCFL